MFIFSEQYSVANLISNIDGIYPASLVQDALRRVTFVNMYRLFDQTYQVHDEHEQVKIIEATDIVKPFKVSITQQPIQIIERSFDNVPKNLRQVYRFYRLDAHMDPI